MLPFLAKRRMIQAINAKNKPEGGLEHEEKESMGLISAAEDILSAIAAKDAPALAQAVKAAFEICEEQPHEEGPHIGEEV